MDRFEVAQCQQYVNTRHYVNLSIIIIINDIYIALNMVLYDALHIALSKLCNRHILRQTRIKRKTEVKHEE